MPGSQGVKRTGNLPSVRLMLILIPDWILKVPSSMVAGLYSGDLDTMEHSSGRPPVEAVNAVAVASNTSEPV